MQTNSKTKYVLLGIMLLMIAGCSKYMAQPYKPERARLGPETPMKQTLTNLPAPKEKIVAAVYKFRDQTGQYKMAEGGSNWSTAVTQGATTILIRALEQSGWFLPIERENINNLLNERKIIRSSKAQYEGKETDLPPLLFAGVILEGGIISYETNLLTGGLGARYFGIGGNTQYRMDRVTVYLRAVSSTSGAILKTVYTSKTLLSQEIKANVYRYVSLTKLLEGEIGFTYNEPSELCVTEAIEKAVQSIIIEGIKEKYWQLNNPKDTLSPAIANYALEKRINETMDVFGNDISNPQQTGGQYRIGLSSGIQQYDGDYGYGEWRPFVLLNSDISINKFLSFGQNIGYQYMFVKKGFYNELLDASLDLKLIVYPYHKMSPILVVRGGSCFSISPNKSNNGKNIYPYIGGDLGIKYRISPKFSLNLSGFYNYMLTDKIDNVKYGNLNDQYWGVKVGFFYHFGF
ncbi:CsgG/HfaB family protein [Alistipes sp. ZOR0009]|uniref:CsgG/HfaB family protein n=1 Tax=Alistipes sp. ZOR0009 TaxID=1339253 RepID=UPI0006475CB0|nr:CsgG/HfaB family protein [Alistipes sp. ZOR0009]